MLDVLKIIAALITIYLIVMLVKELIKIVKERDDYDDKVDLP